MSSHYFPNGYGADIVDDEFGGRVLVMLSAIEGRGWGEDKSTPITDKSGTVRYNDDQTEVDLLARIKALPSVI